MAFNAIKYLIYGALCIVLGLLTWKSHDLSMIHSPDYNSVGPENVTAYMSLTGFGTVLIGTGICLTGLLCFVTDSFIRYIPALAGIAAGFIFMNRAQSRYNGT